MFTMSVNLDRYHAPTIKELCRKFPKFSEREIKLLFREFKQVCPDGIVTENKLSQIYRFYIPFRDVSKYSSLVFLTLDKTSKGYFTFEDFLQFLSITVKGSSTQKLCWLFDLYDVDKDELITHADLMQFSQVASSMVDLTGPCKHTKKEKPSYLSRKAESILKEILQNGNANCYCNHTGINLEQFLKRYSEDETVIRSLGQFDTKI